MILFGEYPNTGMRTNLFGSLLHLLHTYRASFQGRTAINGSLRECSYLEVAAAYKDVYEAARDCFQRIATGPLWWLPLLPVIFLWRLPLFLLGTWCYRKHIEYTKYAARVSERKHVMP